MTDVFISYAGADRERAREVAETLAALGYDVWWDQRIPVGSSWDKFIPIKVREARCLVVLWSKDAVDSKYVREEVRLADVLGRLAPASLDKTQPPFGFGQMEAAQLEDWHPAHLDHNEWLNLLHRIAELSGPPKTAASDVREELAKAFPRSSSKRLAAFLKRNKNVAITIVLVGILSAGAASIATTVALNDPTSFTRSEVAAAAEDARWDVVQQSRSQEALSAFRRAYPLSRHTLDAVALGAELERARAIETRRQEAIATQLAETRASQQSAADRVTSLQHDLAELQSRLEATANSSDSSAARIQQLTAELEAATQEIARLRASRAIVVQRQQDATTQASQQAPPGPVPRNCAGLRLLYQRDSVVTAIERNGAVVTYVGNAVGGGGTYRYVAYRDLSLQVGDTFCGFQGDGGRMRVAGDGG